MTSKIINTLILITLLALPLTSCSTTLKAQVVNRTSYAAGTGETLTVQYYELEDQTLGFIKIGIPEAGVMTLPRVLSASGAKYTDQAAFMWWTKGSEGTLYRINNNGEWDTLYGNCQAIEE